MQLNNIAKIDVSRSKNDWNQNQEDMINGYKIGVH
jgi:hypothetical protein